MIVVSASKEDVAAMRFRVLSRSKMEFRADLRRIVLFGRIESTLFFAIFDRELGAHCSVRSFTSIAVESREVWQEREKV